MTTFYQAIKGTDLNELINICLNARTRQNYKD